MAPLGSKTLRALELGTSKTLSGGSKVAASPLTKPKTNPHPSQPLTTKAGRQTMAEMSPTSALPQSIKRRQQDILANSRTGPTLGSTRVPSESIKQSPWDVTSTLQIYPDNKDVYILTQDGTRQTQVKDIWI